VTTARIALWDNARFLAITLVVLGHALTKTTPATDAAYVLYISIYLFHIPLFVFLSGYFSSAEEPTTKRIQSVIVDLLAPYLIFESIWSAIHSVNAGAFLFNPLRPSWTLWFLLSLAAWRILLPYIASLPAPLTLSIVIALASGYWGVDQTLSLSRTLAFLPFFVLGWRARGWGAGEWWLSRQPATVLSWRIASAAVLAGVVASVALLTDTLRAVGFRKLLTADMAYQQAGFEEWFAGGFRLGVFILAAVMLVAFIALTPRRHTWFSALGGATMTVYLLHSFVLAPLRATEVLSGEIPWWHLIAIILGSVALSVVLASPWVQRLASPLVRPRWVLGRQRR
jgi:fucose 4-O-acetylase-like acetyltransferase